MSRTRVWHSKFVRALAASVRNVLTWCVALPLVFILFPIWQREYEKTSGLAGTRRGDPSE
jgi:hypothetical protein